jgi:hypothetical protein
MEEMSEKAKECWFQKGQTAWNKGKSMSEESIEKMRATRLERFGQHGMNKNHIQNAYLAGIIDGEGTITLNKHKQGTYSAFIIVASTNRPLIDWIQQISGYGQIYAGKPRKANHKVVYTWKVCKNENSFGFLNRIKPYLVIKKRQADLLWEYLTNKRKRNNTRKYSDRDHQIFAELAILNKRGL